MNNNEIRIVTSSGNLNMNEDDIDYIKAKLKGYDITFGKNVNKSIPEYNCPSIEDRKNDIEEAFLDKNVKAIMIARGGALSNQLLDEIDYEIIQKNPKIIIGFSDATSLLNAIYSQTKLKTYYGPNFSVLAMRKGNDYTYASGLMFAGRQSGVSPYHLATRILQEQGNTGYGSCISGNVAGYRGYYNYYNQGAVKSGNISAVVNGMIYASRSDSDSLRPWNTRMKSIVGGAKMIGSSYINRGQSTIYYEKFDVVSSSPYWHQYMTNVMAPRSESQKAANAYSDSTKYNTGLVFTIPVYDNMPQETCTAPDGDGDPGNLLSDMYVDGHSITPSFKKYTQDYSLIVDNNVDRININASAISGSSWVDGAGEHRLNVGENNIEVTVHAENGSDRTYYLTVVRKEPSENPNPPSPDPAPENPSFDTGYNLDSDNMYISGVKAGDNAGTVLGNVRTQNATAYICNRNGDRKGDGDIIATGDRLVINDNSGNEYASYTFIVYGDINGDGEIDLIDIVKIKRHILELSQLKGEFLRAADINRDGEIDLIDIVAVKRHILGMKEITQWFFWEIGEC